MKLVRFLSIVVSVCFFVSMVIGPAYAWKGWNNGIYYEVNMHGRGGEATTTMEKDRVYNLSIVAKNGEIPIENLEIYLPKHFTLEWGMKKEIKIPYKNWNHVFSIKAPNKTGEHEILFKGNDINMQKIGFSVPISVREGEFSEYFSSEARNAVAFAGLFVFIFTVLRISGVI
ncbi:hypothetical protein ACFL5U_00115 [Candidatus Margulisiibacteriota bacterium]